MQLLTNTSFLVRFGDMFTHPMIENYHSFKLFADVKLFNFDDKIFESTSSIIGAIIISGDYKFQEGLDKIIDLYNIVIPDKGLELRDVIKYARIKDAWIESLENYR
jgi:hypothetical protein